MKRKPKPATWAAITAKWRDWFLARLDMTAEGVERYPWLKKEADVYRAAAAELRRAARGGRKS